MSDFIISRSNIDKGKITKHILSIYNEDYPLVKEFHGEWGSLGVSKNLYNGFNPYENDELITIVLGGPVLMFQNNSFLRDENSSEGTKAILDRWSKNKLKWDEDLSGPFVVLFVNKNTNKITCITDLMSFIPVYSYSDSTNIVLSTHVDALAKTTEQNYKSDEVSLVDFILNGIVTYPYTTYKNIFQILPASKHTIKKNSIKLESVNYWLPIEKSKYKSIKQASFELSKSLQRYTDKITDETNNISQFISGGEDSRMLSGLIKHYPRDAYVFLDQMNREGKIAKRVAGIYGANIKISTRNKLHYLEILPNCSDLVGSGAQYQHAHTYGFHHTCNLNSYNAVFGGLFSDALLKGSHIKKIRGSSRLPFLPDIERKNYSVTNLLENPLFKKDVLAKLTKRRKNHLNYIKEFRNESAEEWFELWPSSMNSNIANIHTNRRLFSSYEPFTSIEVVKISASIPQKWKLNRRLFYKTAKPYLKSSKSVLHGDGWLPSLPWYLNIFVHFTTWFYRQVGRKLGWIMGNQGPWGESSFMVHSAKWNKFLENKNHLNKLPITDKKKSLSEILGSGVLSVTQYINLTQVLYEIDRKD